MRSEKQLQEIPAEKRFHNEWYFMLAFIIESLLPIVVINVLFLAMIMLIVKFIANVLNTVYDDKLKYYFYKDYLIILKEIIEAKEDVTA